MAEFQILDASRSQDQALWLQVWGKLPDLEAFAHPAFSALFAHPSIKTLCAWYHDEGGEVLFPFTLRDLSREPWCFPPVQCSDLITPYGYGGPYRIGEPSADGFWGSFTQWANEASVVSGFLRRSLFPEQLIPLQTTEHQIALNVVRTLQAPIETLWMEYEHKVRKNVNKAKRNGLTCKPDPEWLRLGDFLEIYRATMDRRSASNFYLFDDSFFEGIHKNLNEQALLFHVRDATDRIISTELVLLSTRNIYSFLGGTLPEGFKVAANDLLKHTIIEWGHDQGKDNFVLGGGFRAGDGIFLYKKAFATDGVKPFQVGQLIWDPGTYAQLIVSRRNWEAAQGRQWEPAAGFFPAYRAPGYQPDAHHD